MPRSRAQAGHRTQSVNGSGSPNTDSFVVLSSRWCEKQHSERQQDGPLKPLVTLYEPRRGASGSRGWRLSQLLVSSGWQSIQFLLDHFLQSPHYTQVWVDVAFFLPVENLLTIQIHFEPAIRAGGERDCNISTKGTKELIRHPRGGCVMFSSDAVHDVHENFPFRSHPDPPSYSYQLTL